MAASVAPQQSELLTSWKEIASYLGKGVRTVQRWEQQFGLPVRRPNEKAKGIVHASRQELDEWLARQWSQRPREFAHANSASRVCIEQVRIGMQQAAELHQANRLLIQHVRVALLNVFQECQTLARNMNGTPSRELDFELDKLK